MMSGHAGHQDVVKAIKLGAVDFLKKPLHDILPLVRKLLSENINDGEKFEYTKGVIDGFMVFNLRPAASH
jgi:FixJ family two-component response regulator